MKNMKIKTRLVTGFLLIAVLTVIVGGVGIYALRITSDETQLLSSRATMAIMSARLARNINQQRAAYLGLVAFDEIGDYDTADEYLNALNTYAADFEKTTAELATMFTLPETKQMLSEINTVYDEFVTLRGNLVSVMEEISESRIVIDTGSESEEEGAAAATSADHIRQDVRNALLDIADVAGALVDDIVVLTDYIDGLTNDQETKVSKDSAMAIVISAVILIAAIVIAVILGLRMASGISKPINLMMGFLRQVGETGNLTFSEEALGNMRESMNYKNEVSQSLAAFVRMLEHLIRCGTALQSVAARDLTVRVETLGVSDTIGNALTTMVSNLNDMFDEINVASSQVSGGSQQIANGAQSLAQGASEQAASVE
ncbi:MAG: methyl-accepting chemotaxis protein, partial [Clostridiales Family XIII bacterium]|nr:methyl-accepting chemotaxis protein [Clostridiales Family XIII bacterium]